MLILKFAKDKITMRYLVKAVVSIAACLLTTPPAEAGDAFGLRDKDRIAIFHAEGAQIYQCQRGSGGSLYWKFLEPIASLFDGSRSVGRHYAGPSWELADGAVVRGQAIAQAPSGSESAVPHLLLKVTSPEGRSIAEAKTIVRLNTKGGVAPHQCSEPGTFLSVPYSADYAFYTSPLSE